MIIQRVTQNVEMESVWKEEERITHPNTLNTLIDSISSNKEKMDDNKKKGVTILFMKGKSNKEKYEKCQV